MERVYVETSVISLLVADLSSNLITASRQLITRQWWAQAPQRFELVISEVVLNEIRRGDSRMAQKRLEVVRGLPRLALGKNAKSILPVYEARLGLASNARVDILHLAVAVSHEVDYVATWNLKHLANATVIRRLQRLNTELGVYTPLIMTPESLDTE